MGGGGGQTEDAEPSSEYVHVSEQSRAEHRSEEDTAMMRVLNSTFHRFISTLLLKSVFWI